MRFTPRRHEYNRCSSKATSVDGALAMGPDACCDQVRVPYQNARPRTGRQDRSDTGVGDKLRGAGLGAAAGLPRVTAGAAQLCPWDPTGLRPARSTRS